MRHHWVEACFYETEHDPSQDQDVKVATVPVKKVLVKKKKVPVKTAQTAPAKVKVTMKCKTLYVSTPVYEDAMAQCGQKIRLQQSVEAKR